MLCPVWTWERLFELVEYICNECDTDVIDGIDIFVTGRHDTKAK